ncbi:FecCD family ABC transporter permease [Ruicaihuangia caeni]|uniref:Iron chelate uptake ABC transporter family permease subunit n=1 Tax=Ruicaihuangia caeni TaxID=3042517 RepID=A0AAW6T1I0_9MICO|nr:iron chelate uptake ABC transporter family permease subunit [Klugiella sp. YN-L-19]MDI2097685.1 iron chelate uptake ABC transporter family permease subunit [Klugiella sp. YN-L-19]
MAAALPAVAAVHGRVRSRTDSSVRRTVGLAACGAVLLAAVWLSLAVGSRSLDPATVIGALTDPSSASVDHLVVRELRVPRTVIGIAVGAALAVAGTLMQGLTRNPLADPGLLGVNAGASLFVVLAITLFGLTSPAAFVWFAFAGAAAATVLVYAVGSAGREGATPMRLALAGTALTAGITSIISVLLITRLDTVNAYRLWSVGSLAARELGDLATLLPFLLAGIVLAAICARPLDLLAMGDDLARGLGQNLALARITATLAIVLLCGAATALAGPIVFIGLVIPHIVRPFVGASHGWMLAWACLLGPALLLLADVIGRIVAAPGELEAGLVAAAIGAPVMIAVVRTSKAVRL